MFLVEFKPRFSPQGYKYIYIYIKNKMQFLIHYDHMNIIIQRI